MELRTVIWSSGRSYGGQEGHMAVRRIIPGVRRVIPGVRREIPGRTGASSQDLAMAL